MTGQRIGDLAEHLREIASVDRTACVEELATMPGVTLPPRLRAEALRRLLAYEVQARVLGGLSARERRALRLIATGKSAGDDSAAKISHGSHLVREWNGRTYRVEVTGSGYILDGTTYRSLSAVAKRITGTAWSGPRFFGLTGMRSA